MKKLVAISLYLLPAVALAQVTGGGTRLTNIDDLIRSIGRIINLLLPLVVAVALLVFFWGLGKFILAAGDEEARKAGRQLMIWGIIAFVVMLSVWGLVNFVRSAFGLDRESNVISVPQV